MDNLTAVATATEAPNLPTDPPADQQLRLRLLAVVDPNRRRPERGIFRELLRLAGASGPDESRGLDSLRPHGEPTAA